MCAQVHVGNLEVFAVYSTEKMQRMPMYTMILKAFLSEIYIIMIIYCASIVWLMRNKCNSLPLNPAVYNEQGCKFENMYYTRYPETSYNGGA